MASNKKLIKATVAPPRILLELIPILGYFLFGPFLKNNFFSFSSSFWLMASIGTTITTITTFLFFIFMLTSAISITITISLTIITITTILIVMLRMFCNYCGYFHLTFVSIDRLLLNLSSYGDYLHPTIISSNKFNINHPKMFKWKSTKPNSRFSLINFIIKTIFLLTTVMLCTMSCLATGSLVTPTNLSQNFHVVQRSNCSSKVLLLDSVFEMDRRKVFLQNHYLTLSSEILPSKVPSIIKSQNSLISESNVALSNKSQKFQIKNFTNFTTDNNKTSLKSNRETPNNNLNCSSIIQQSDNNNITAKSIQLDRNLSKWAQSFPLSLSLPFSSITTDNNNNITSKKTSNFQQNPSTPPSHLLSQFVIDVNRSKQTTSEPNNNKNKTKWNHFSFTTKNNTTKILEFNRIPINSTDRVNSSSSGWMEVNMETTPESISKRRGRIKRRKRRKRSTSLLGMMSGAAPSSSTITINVPLTNINSPIYQSNCSTVISRFGSNCLNPNNSNNCTSSLSSSARTRRYRRLLHRRLSSSSSLSTSTFANSVIHFTSTNANQSTKALHKRMTVGVTLPLPQSPPLLPEPEMLISVTPTAPSSAELAQRKNQEKDFEIIGTLTGVAGGKIALPCNITPVLPNDAVSLILWYKDESTTPIYSVDARKGVSLDAARRVTDENLASRSYMNTMTRPYAHMMLELLTIEDAGEYACRVDFRKERTRNSVIFLKIIIPPEKPQIKDSAGETQASLIGPYTEGDRLALVCEVEGGKPVPSVTWWRESVLLDDSYEAITSSAVGSSSSVASLTTSGSSIDSPTITVVRNELVINALQRHDLMAVFTCQASNNNISLPTTTTVTVDLNFRPVSVKIVDQLKPLSSDKLSILTCSSSGSRPPATITWWLGSTKLKRSEEQISVDGNTTTSRLTITPTIDDIGKKVTCRAENQQIPSSAIEDSIKLEINFVPQITLRLGSNLRHSHIQEGNDVYFECVIRASPWVTEIRWHFEGRELQTNTSAGVIVSNQSLVLQKVRRNHRGKYTCTATNAEGEGESNAIHLRVQFSPICKPGQKILYGAARQETVSVLCEVESDPADVTFHWSYNGTTTGNSGGEPGKTQTNSANSLLNFESSGSLSSVARYTPLTEFDYGTIYCWAHNSVGVQTKPCAYSIVAAGSPDSVRNCSVLNVTEDSMKVECLEGYDGGLLQHFVLESYDTTSDRASSLRANLSSPTASFNLNRLQPAHSYLLLIYSANAKGRSKGLALTAFTLAMPESMNRLAKGNVWQLNFNPVLIVLIAIVTGVVLVAFFVVAIVRWRNLKPSMLANRYQREKESGSGNNNNTSNGKPDHMSSSVNQQQSQHQQHFSAVFRKGGNLVEEICDVCTTCTPGESDDTENCTIKTKSSDLGPDISLTSSSEGATSKSAAIDDYGLPPLHSHRDQSPNYHQTVDPNDEKLTSLLPGSRQSQAQQQQCVSSGMSINGSSNIYTSTPLSSSNSSTVGATTNNNAGVGAATTTIANNKHVTWRPETPPSPPPNLCPNQVYTQYSAMSTAAAAYVPVQSSNSFCEDSSSSLLLGSMGVTNNNSATISSSSNTSCSSYPSSFDGMMLPNHHHPNLHNSPYAAAYHSHPNHNYNQQQLLQHAHLQPHLQQQLPMSYTISTGLSGHHDQQPGNGGGSLINGSQSNYLIGSQFPYSAANGGGSGLLLGNSSTINPYQMPPPTSLTPQPQHHQHNQPILQPSGYSTLQHPRRVRILPVSSASSLVQQQQQQHQGASAMQMQMGQFLHRQSSLQTSSSPSNTNNNNNADDLNRRSPMTEV